MWIYNGETLPEDLIPELAIGFIYLIECQVNNKKYIGKKLLTKSGGFKTVKGKRKRKPRKASDWLKYYGSCTELKEDVKVMGEHAFKRTVIMFCDTQSMLNYQEAKLQYKHEVLESDTWYNANIVSRVYKKNILGKLSNKEIIVV